jgi:hypothetical protein
MSWLIDPKELEESANEIEWGNNKLFINVDETIHKAKQTIRYFKIDLRDKGDVSADSMEDMQTSILDLWWAKLGITNGLKKGTLLRKKLRDQDLARWNKLLDELERLKEGIYVLYGEQLEKRGQPFPKKRSFVE